MTQDRIKFNVRVIQNRRFDLPLDKAIEIIKDMGHEDCENWSNEEIADYLFGSCSEVLPYEDLKYSDSCYGGHNYEVEMAEVYRFTLVYPPKKC